MPRIFWIMLLLGGGGGLLVLTPLAFGGLEWIVDFVISMQMSLVEGRNTYEIWRKPPIPIYLKVCIFNITNPSELSTGAKPILQEVGPYVYRETLEKVNITLQEVNDTIKFNQIHRYYFLPEMSNGIPDDVVTFINIPFVTVAQMAHAFTDVEYILDSLDSMLSSKGEQLLKTHTVREFLFDGFDVQAFVDLIEDPIVQGAGEVKMPEMIKDGKMGLLKGRNGSSDGTWEVLTGTKNSKNFTRIQSYNGDRAMTVWKHPSCNAINGTDGIMHQPFLTEQTPLEIFIAQMCRTIRYDYVATVKHRGITAFQFKIPDSLFQSVHKNPHNWCFCPGENSSECSITGVMYIGPCVEGAPMLISQPHFVGADASLTESVVGINADPEKHSGHLIIHPKTGVTLEARHRFQFNMQLQQWSAMPTFAEVPTVLVPLFWIEEGANIDEANKFLLKLLDTFLFLWSIIRWMLIASCIISLLTGGFFMNQYNKAKDLKAFEDSKGNH